MKSIRIHAKIMDAEIDDDKRGKPQRWESKELYNNMKSSRIHERLQEDRDRSEDETGNVLSNILKRHHRSGATYSTFRGLNPRKSDSDIDKQVNRIADRAATRQDIQQGTQIDAKGVGNPNRRSEFHKASVGRIHKAMGGSTPAKRAHGIQSGSRSLAFKGEGSPASSPRFSDPQNTRWKRKPGPMRPPNIRSAV
tara:strand:+ start:3388 stop:3972 length:585 start_codon:yes stop_codon:yes gene_type:complete